MRLVSFKKTIRQGASWFGVILVLAGCGLQITPSNQGWAPEKITPPHTVKSAEWVDTTFTVSMNALPAAETRFVLDVLDPVAGLDNNIQRFTLSQSGGGQYSAVIPLPLGSVVQYRYAVAEPEQWVEQTPEGQAVLFRNAFITEQTQIKDTIASWPDIPYTSPTGSLNGIVTDQKTDNPIPDVLITLAGYQTYTDATGRFYLQNLPVGVHNLVAATIDGSYQVFQQQANVVAGLSTPALIKLEAMPLVTGTFITSLPEEARGAPVRLAGSLSQTGNSFSDPDTGLTSPANRMPMLTAREDGRFEVQLRLHAGSFLRYKYTLGDGLINAERDSNGQLVNRQFIVPDRDFTVNDQVLSWRVDGTEPASIIVTAPQNTPKEDSISIQLLTDTWRQPIPMWPLGSNRWMILLYGDSSAPDPLFYRFCRNDLCEIAAEEGSLENPRQVNFADPSANTSQISSWQAWNPTGNAGLETQTPVSAPTKVLSGIEFINYYQPSHFWRYLDILTVLQNAGINWIILTPRWTVNTVQGLPFITSDPAETMLISELSTLIEKAHDMGFSVALYPQLRFDGSAAEWWAASQRDALWWQQWYQQYERFILNYVIFSAENKVDQFIVGGSQVQSTFPGVLQTEGMNFGTPQNSAELWTDLLKKIDQYYSGELLWAQPLSLGTGDYEFLSYPDGFYLQVSSSLLGQVYTTDTIRQYLDDILADLSKEGTKPVYFGLSAPSALSNSFDEAASLECLSPFNPNLGAEDIDFFGQQYFYDSWLSVLSTSGRMAGFSSRGFFPVAQLTDFSDSIYGKPAMQVIRDYNRTLSGGN